MDKNLVIRRDFVLILLSVALGACGAKKTSEPRQAAGVKETGTAEQRHSIESTSVAPVPADVANVSSNANTLNFKLGSLRDVPAGAVISITLLGANTNEKRELVYADPLQTEFTGLLPGNFTVSIEVRTNNQLVRVGSGKVEVNGGKVATVSIAMLPAPANGERGSVIVEAKDVAACKTTSGQVCKGGLQGLALASACGGAQSATAMPISCHSIGPFISGKIHISRMDDPSFRWEGHLDNFGKYSVVLSAGTYQISVIPDEGVLLMPSSLLSSQVTISDDMVQKDFSLTYLGL